MSGEGNGVGQEMVIHADHSIDTHSADVTGRGQEVVETIEQPLVNDDSEPVSLEKDWYSLTSNEQGREIDRVISECDLGRTERILKREWGLDFQKNLDFATAAWKAFRTPEIDRVIDAVGITNHPAYVKALARIGRQLAAVPGDPATLKLNKETTTMEDKRSLQREYEELTAKLHDARLGGRTWDVKTIDARRREVSEQLHGNEPYER